MRPNIESLLQQMTIEEKVGQMTQVAIDMLCEGKPYKLDKPLTINEEKLHQVVVDYNIGSILNVGTSAHSKERWHEIMTAIQDKTQNTRLQIPVLYGIDAIHGVTYTKNSTLFPQQLALASTWNLTHSENTGSVTAYETRASSIPWNFSPVLDLGKQPVWPRLWETFGEDVHLSTQMGLAMVKGYQGDDISDKTKVAACLKHFTGYGMPLSGTDRTPAWIPERYFQEYYLPAFQAAIDAGAATIMINSGEVNGVPVHASHYILTKVLREQLGFKGLAVTDWEDIRYLHFRHRIADSHKEAVRLAVEAGIDMSMVPNDFSFYEHLVDLVKEGRISEERLDISVRRILQLKVDLGLFETTHHHPSEFPDFGSEKFRQTALQAAKESVVLLKNEAQTLPLKKDGLYLVTGPTAHSQRSLNGGWTNTWQGDETDEVIDYKPTVLEAIREKIGEENVIYTEGCGFKESIPFPKNVDISKVDAIVLCLGETSYTEFMGNIHDLYLPDAQVDFAKKMIALGKPVILVLLEGRPRLISKFEEGVSGALVSFLPGTEGGEAIADVLFGDYNPDGKLPITYPRHPNSLLNYDHKYTEALPLDDQTDISFPQYEFGEHENTFFPQYEFGHGLSYTTFKYSNLKISQQQLTEQETLEISVTVQNIGNRQGKEVVQLYISDLYASITPPVKRLRGFEKIQLAPNESKTITFNITTKDLAFVGLDNQWITEKGDFEIKINQLKTVFKVI